MKKPNGLKRPSFNIFLLSFSLSPPTPSHTLTEPIRLRRCTLSFIRTEFENRMNGMGKGKGGETTSLRPAEA